MHWQEYISSDPEILFGKPVIKGTGIPVDLILEKLAAGHSNDDLLKAYPHLTAESIRACLLFAADFSHSARKTYNYLHSDEQGVLSEQETVYQKLNLQKFSS